MTPTKPVPRPTPDTQEFWDGTAAGELRIKRCSDCNTPHFPPRIFCPVCLSENVVWEKASGKGFLYSYVINQRPMPAWGGPYAIAVVELDEGPRMMSNIVGVEQTPEALELDMRLEVTFEDRDGVKVPVFKPEGMAL